MKLMKGTVEGQTVATYRKGPLTWICKISNGFYTATFHNGRQSAMTYYTKDKNEINEFIKAEVANGFVKEKMA